MSKTFAEELTEDRRCIILDTLSRAIGYRANDDILRMTLTRIALPAGIDQVRADVQWLADAGLTRIEIVSDERGDRWIVHLTRSGLEVAEGRRHAGVAKLRPS